MWNACLFSGIIILQQFSRFLVNISLLLFVMQHVSLSLFLSRSQITLAKSQLEELIWAICIADPEKEEQSLKSHWLSEARASQRAPREGGHRRYCWESTLFVDAASRATERQVGGLESRPTELIHLHLYRCASIPPLTQTDDIFISLLKCSLPHPPECSPS